MSSSFFIILFHRNAWTHFQDDIAKSDMRYETLPPPLYFPDLLPNGYRFFKHLVTFLLKKKKKKKKFCSKREVETAFKEFLASTLLVFLSYMHK